MKQSVNPNTVILAREYRELSQKELASKLDVTPPLISRIEAGLSPVSEEILNKLSTVLDLPIKFFFENINIYPPGVHFYRKAKGISPRLLASINAAINIDSIRIDKLLQSTRITTDDIPYIDLEANFEKYESPAAIAKAIRYTFGLPDGPIDNMTAILEDAGILVVHSKFNTRHFDAVSFRSRSGRYIVFVNANMPGDRLRFSLAHELGHIIMHKLPHDKIEDEANEFASEFLMPALEIRNHLSFLTLESLGQLKTYWKVSMQALLMRASRLEMISYNQYRYLWMLMSKMGYKINEPIEIKQEAPTLLSEIVDVHIKDLGYTDEELKTILYMNDNEYIKFNPSAKNKIRSELKLIYHKGAPHLDEE